MRWRPIPTPTAASAAPRATVERRQAATSASASPLEQSRSKGRPLSPDLLIYQPQLTWVLSGFYRVSSVGLTTGAAWS